MKKAIYGTGNYGKLLFNYFKKNGISIDCFIQTRKNVMDYCGLKVLSFDELECLDDELTVYIAIKNIYIVRDIQERIEGLGKNIKTYICSNFITDNLITESFVSGNDNAAEGARVCNICNNDFDKYIPGGMDSKLIKYRIIGCGHRENYLCPICGSVDRTRWLYYVLKNHTDILTKGGRVLHFAPEETVSEIIKQNTEIDYYTGDIEKGVAMHITDITDIQYKDSTFDYVICNHVMEHIKNEEKAVSEIKRVLKDEGKWIFSFPICMDINTLEDDHIISEKERLYMYGQGDHVRLYGKDFKERFANYGLKLEVYSPGEELSEDVIDRLGFINNDIIIIAGK